MFTTTKEKRYRYTKYTDTDRAREIEIQTLFEIQSVWSGTSRRPALANEKSI